MPISLHIESGRLEVAAGGEATARVVVRNLGSQPTQADLRLVNAPAWASLPVDQVGLFPGETVRVALRLQPPAGVPLGGYPVGVEAVEGREAAGTAPEADTLEAVVVAPAGQPLPDVTAAPLAAPAVTLKVLLTVPEFQTQTTVTVEAETAAAEPVTVRLHARDDQGLCWFSFAPQQLVIPAGGRGSAELTIRAQAGVPQSRDTRAVVTALPLEGDTPLAQATVSLRLEPILAPVVEITPLETGPTDIAHFKIRIANSARMAVSFRLKGVDEGASLLYAFNPPLVTVPGQRQGDTILTVTPHVALKEKASPIERVFRVRAEAVGDALPPGEASGRFLQAPVVPPSIDLTSLRPPLRTELHGADKRIVVAARASTIAFDLPIQNPNPFRVTADVRQVGDDPSVRLTFEPNHLSLPPNATVNTRVTLRALQPMAAAERKRKLPFTLEVFTALGGSTPQDGALEQEAPGGLPLRVRWERAWQKLRPVRHGLIYLLCILIAVPAIMLLCLLPTTFALDLVAPVRTVTVTPTPTATPTATATPTPPRPPTSTLPPGSPPAAGPPAGGPAGPTPRPP